jgi:DNA primase
MRFNRTEINPLLLWSHYVELPHGATTDQEFLSLIFCPNPGHDNFRSPAFQINVKQPLVHCFSRCGIEGTYTHAVSVIEGLYEKFGVEEAANDRERRRRRDRAWREADRIILRISRTGEKTYRYTKKHRPSATIAAVQPSDVQYDLYLPAVAQEYLKSRGIFSRSISFWRLGWLPDEKRIVIPADDIRGKTQFLIKRAVLDSQNPKYLYSEGFPKSSLLFGAGNIGPGMIQSDGLILVEGSLDTIRLHQHGFKNTAAILGTGISEVQRGIISRLRREDPPLLRQGRGRRQEHRDRDAGVTEVSACSS